MVNFPTWINKNKSTTMNTNNNLSPRQVANKAYALAIKKLDKDDKRRRPQYSVRERLLLSNTIARAEDVLNKYTPSFNRRVLACEIDDASIPPAKKIVIAPVDTAPIIGKPNQVLNVKVTPVTPPQIKNEPLLTPEQQKMAAVSLAVAAAYSSLSATEQQALISSSREFCRPIMVPSHTNMASITTII